MVQGNQFFLPFKSRIMINLCKFVPGCYDDGVPLFPAFLYSSLPCRKGLLESVLNGFSSLLLSLVGAALFPEISSEYMYMTLVQLHQVQRLSHVQVWLPCPLLWHSACSWSFIHDGKYVVCCCGQCCIVCILCI